MCESTQNRSLVEEKQIQVDFSKRTLHDYEVLAVIGSGEYGTCFTVRHRETQGLYAWKGMDFDDWSENKQKVLVDEVNILSSLQHPNIVQYYHHLVNHASKTIYLVMEFCDGGDLAQLMKRTRAEAKRLEESFIWSMILQLSKAVQFCDKKKRQIVIKPANVLLDHQGNAKLDAYNLGQERKEEDIAALGRLIYELVVLRPPYEFKPIPAVYSQDLQDVIDYMLAPDASIETMLSQPALKHQSEILSIEYPRLIPVEQDFYCVATDASPCDNLILTEHNSYTEEYGRRRLSMDSAFTPDLRTEIFYSARRRIFAKSIARQNSDPQLYETICQAEYASIEPHKLRHKSPSRLTSHVFDEALQERLHAIRARESLLQQQAADLQERERALHVREQRLQQLELRLQERTNELDVREKQIMLKTVKRGVDRVPPMEVGSQLTRREQELMVKRPLERVLHVEAKPPPIPPRKPLSHDDTYCSIEQDSPTQQAPTMAKLNLAALPAPKAFPSALRKVTFQSPKKFITYDIDGISATHRPFLAQNSMAVKVSSEDSAYSDNSASTVPQRRKSILSIFGLSRSNKDVSTACKSGCANIEKKSVVNETKVLAACATTELNHIWTKENKRAAFALLAAMKEAERGETQHGPTTVTTMATANARNKLRQSVRERSGSLQRHRLRRSLIAPPTHGLTSASRDGILV